MIDIHQDIHTFASSLGYGRAEAQFTSQQICSRKLTVLRGLLRELEPYQLDDFERILGLSSKWQGRISRALSCSDFSGQEAENAI
jgi:hypothetical protein